MSNRRLDAFANGEPRSTDGQANGQDAVQCTQEPRRIDGQQLMQYQLMQYQLMQEMQQRMQYAYLRQSVYLSLPFINPGAPQPSPLTAARPRLTDTEGECGWCNNIIYKRQSHCKTPSDPNGVVYHQQTKCRSAESVALRAQNRAQNANKRRRTSRRQRVGSSDEGRGGATVRLAVHVQRGAIVALLDVVVGSIDAPHAAWT